MTATVEAKTKVKFRAWTAPNYACIVQENTDRETPSISVKDLDAEALEALALSWLEDLYSKTDHRNPFRSIADAP